MDNPTRLFVATTRVPSSSICSLSRLLCGLPADPSREGIVFINPHVHGYEFTLKDLRNIGFPFGPSRCPSYDEPPETKAFWLRQGLILATESAIFIANDSTGDDQHLRQFNLLCCGEAGLPYLGLLGIEYEEIRTTPKWCIEGGSRLPDDMRIDHGYLDAYFWGARSSGPMLD